MRRERLIAAIDRAGGGHYGPATFRQPERLAMKIVNSLKSLKKRHKDCRLVRRKGRVYVINKKDPRYKARQG